MSATHSLRARLLWFILVAILLGAVLQAITAYRGALQQADAMFDDHLQQVARSMRSGAPLGGAFEEGTDGDGFDLYVQIWGPDGTQLFRSSRSALPPRAVLGFSDVEANGNRYRVYSLQTPLQTVQIAQDLSARTARARALAIRAVLPFALLTPLLMLAVWWVISRSLAPIERARKQVAQRAADDFSPLPNTDLPDEVRPLVDELNLLFGRVRGAFDAQKNFVADAAHELRSPLTALKLQAQALRKPDDDPAAREAGVARLNQGIDRAIRLVEQLLALARAEAAGTPASGSAHAALQDVVKLAVADVLPHAQHRQIDLGVAGDLPDAPVKVSGQLEALRVLLRNLLDNAVKYTPTGGRVDVSLQLDGGQPLLRVEDSGPGIAEEERERVFDRFYRGAQTVAAANHGEEASAEAAPATGSGLGLAIVQAIAAQHGATLQLGRSERLGGLQVDVRFPPSASPR
ncbi:MAG: sensor histidine kinase N-terminal domain-containing protein [Polaromonas sp.]|uniref:ATP-binding protein n=1 Tax=Polaromonas sp. TaxID=1869339 RepID=UPI0025D1B322|nr:ATP-binding protein [Polaromonas sp.]MBI2726796.1 sensor histidine kinase N-terminal domain-containing protein [Polaromonas sp.]